MIQWEEIHEGSLQAKVWTGQIIGHVHRDFGSQEEAFAWRMPVLTDLVVAGKKMKVSGSCKTKKAAKAALIRTWFRWCSRMGLYVIPKGHRF